ncbi:MAG TPA: acetate--CoA ligase [Chloroflexota bacterium]|nr:acetate--CoA ligase [Chloroflexota bacterium]
MALAFEDTNRVLQEERLFTPSADIVEQANVTAYARSKGFGSYEQLYAWTIEHPEDFWADMAGRLDWSKPWSRVLDWNRPFAKWFVDAECNIVHNALDRHMGTPVENKVAYYWEGEGGQSKTVTYRQLFDMVNRFASALKKLGIKKGDIVAVYMPPIIEEVVAMLALARIGAAHTVVFSGFTAEALRSRIDDAQAVAVITADGYFRRGRVVGTKAVVDDAIKGTTVRHVIVAKRANSDVPMEAGRDLWFDEVMNTGDAACPCEPMDSEDLLYTLYTSGTTGKPKAIVHVHGGYMVGAYATAHFIFDLKPNDVYWCAADPGWVTGHSYIVYGPLLNGVSSILYDGTPDFPDPGIWWALVEKYKATILYCAPTAIRGLMRFGEEHPAKHDLSSLRLLGSVGEPINPEAWMWYRQITGDRCPIMDTWWQTETGAIMISPVPSTSLKPGSATRPFLGIEADVLNMNGQPVGSDKGGFLVIRKPWPSMLRTIYRDPERYQTQYWSQIPGVYFAGDAAHKDKDGYYWVQGRVDDVIKVAGHRLGSSEIESALVSHPAVAEAAVIGKPHQLKGESIKAFCILRQGNEPTDALLAELRSHVRNTIGPIAQPDELEFVPSLPKTRSGKIMRRLLKARELGEDVGDVSTLDG